MSLVNTICCPSGDQRRRNTFCVVEVVDWRRPSGSVEAETADVGSVRGRSSGRLESAQAVHRLQQMTTSNRNSWRICI